MARSAPELSFSRIVSCLYLYCFIYLIANNLLLEHLFVSYLVCLRVRLCSNWLDCIFKSAGGQQFMVMVSFEKNVYIELFLCLSQEIMPNVMQN